MQKMYKGVLTLALFGVMMVPVSQAKAQTIDEMLKMIQMLTAQIQTLQSQLDGLNEQVLSITENPTLGAEGEDVTVIQELLASDPTLYPEGKVTGYYGPLTSEAIKRFQARQNLPPTGVVDDVTETILNGYLMDLGSIHVDDAAEIPMGYLGDIKRVRKVSTDLLAENCKTLEGETEDHLCKVLSDAFDDHMRSLDIDEDGIKEDFEQEVDDLIRDRFKNAFNHSDDEDSNDSSDEDVTEDDTANDDVEVVELTPADKASEAVSDAQREISDAEDALDGADGDTTVAEDLISDAKTALSKAQRAKRSKNFDGALASAKEAKNLAEDALALLEDTSTGDPSTDASDAIDTADSVISDAEDALDGADGDTTVAEDLISDAKTALSKAQRAKRNKNFESAVTNAKEARNLATKALRALN